MSFSRRLRSIHLQRNAAGSHIIYKYQTSSRSSLHLWLSCKVNLRHHHSAVPLSLWISLLLPFLRMEGTVLFPWTHLIPTFLIPGTLTAPPCASGACTTSWQSGSQTVPTDCFQVSTTLQHPTQTQELSLQGTAASLSSGPGAWRHWGCLPSETSPAILTALATPAVWTNP